MRATRKKSKDPASAWVRKGRLTIQSSHGLSPPLVRQATEWVEREAAAAAPALEQPQQPLPDFIPHDRPPHRLPEDSMCRSPIAGLVIAVSVAPGEVVKKHQPVLVIEAMKMQNNVSAKVDGCIKAIHVSPGDAVQAGQLLFELD